MNKEIFCTKLDSMNESSSKNLTSCLVSSILGDFLAKSGNNQNIVLKDEF